mgnify:CR=1 FL=1
MYSTVVYGETIMKAWFLIVLFTTTDDAKVAVYKTKKDCENYTRNLITKLGCSTINKNKDEYNLDSIKQSETVANNSDSHRHRVCHWCSQKQSKGSGKKALHRVS